MTLFRKKLIFFLPWIIVLLWMILIYHLSAQPASQSAQLSSGITELVMETVKRMIPALDLSMDQLEHIVRKNAHFFIYLALGILVCNALVKSGITGLKGFFLTIGICILYASSDEIHQIFVPGRGPGVKDVIIDSLGALVGIGVYKISSLALTKMKRNRFKRKLNGLRVER